GWLHTTAPPEREIRGIRGIAGRPIALNSVRTSSFEQNKLPRLYFSVRTGDMRSMTMETLEFVVHSKTTTVLTFSRPQPRSLRTTFENFSATMTTIRTHFWWSYSMKLLAS